MPKAPKEKKTTSRRATPRKVTAAVRRPRAKKVEATHEHIAMRAYYLHLEQPFAEPQENWLRAERELLA